MTNKEHGEYESRRDEVCAVSVMWFIHLLSDETKAQLMEENIRVPSIPLTTAGILDVRRELCFGRH